MQVILLKKSRKNLEALS